MGRLSEYISQRNFIFFDIVDIVIGNFWNKVKIFIYNQIRKLFILKIHLQWHNLNNKKNYNKQLEKSIRFISIFLIKKVFMQIIKIEKKKN